MIDVQCRLSVKVGYKDPKETSKELFEERRREEIFRGENTRIEVRERQTRG